MGAGSPGGSRRAISCDTVAATSSSVLATTAESASKFTPCSSALGKTASAATSTAGSICLPCRSTELSRKELGDAPLAIVVRPGAGERSQARFVGRRLWTLEENRTAGCGRPQATPQTVFTSALLVGENCRRFFEVKMLALRFSRRERWRKARSSGRLYSVPNSAERGNKNASPHMPLMWVPSVLSSLNFGRVDLDGLVG